MSETVVVKKKRKRDKEDRKKSRSESASKEHIVDESLGSTSASPSPPTTSSSKREKKAVPSLKSSLSASSLPVLPRPPLSPSSHLTTQSSSLLPLQAPDEAQEDPAKKETNNFKEPENLETSSSSSSSSSSASSLAPAVTPITEPNSPAHSAPSSQSSSPSPSASILTAPFFSEPFRIEKSTSIFPTDEPLSMTLSDAKKREPDSEILESKSLTLEEPEAGRQTGPKSTNYFSERGFKRFLDLNLLSDLTLISNGRTFHLHRLIVCNASQFFYNELNKSPSSQPQTTSTSSSFSSFSSSSSSSSSSILNGSKTTSSSSSSSLLAAPSPSVKSSKRHSRKKSGSSVELLDEKEKEKEKEEKREKGRKAHFTSTISYDSTGRPTIELQIPDDTNNLMETVIEYIYTGQCNFTPDNGMALLSIADHFLMADLTRIAAHNLSLIIDRENALFMLQRAVKFKVREMVEKCINVIATNFCFLYDCNYSFIPPSVFVAIVQHPELAVKSESALWKEIVKYIKERSRITDRPVPSANTCDGTLSVNQCPICSRKERREGDPLKRLLERIDLPLTEDDVHSMMSAVRFKWFTLTALKEASESLFVPKHLLVEALLSKYEEAESKLNDLHPRGPVLTTKKGGEGDMRDEMASEVVPVRLQKRPIRGLVFDYKPQSLSNSSIEDHKGVVHWLSTHYGRMARENPHTCGRLLVTSSSVEKGHERNLVDAKPSELWTSDVPSSWFCIDLGPNRKIVPTAYSLRHGGNYRADSLRTWDFQGSVDGTTWILLRRHANDCSLNAPYAVHSWEIVGTDEAFRYFRILQTGHNSSNHNFLVASGFEIFGTLFDN